MSDGEPVHERGVVPGEPGLYFVGLHFLYAMSSTMIHGVGRDAEHVAAGHRGANPGSSSRVTRAARARGGRHWVSAFMIGTNSTVTV